MKQPIGFRIVNVFAQAPLEGNPLAVVEDGTGLSDAQMQQIARQFNLSETTFLLPSAQAEARVRIFTPNFEMPFAGHPTLGSAHVLRSLGRAGDALRLEMKAGVIPVQAGNDAATRDTWTLSARPATFREYTPSIAEIADALGLAPADIAGRPAWVNAGVEQLIVPIADVAAVASAMPRVEACRRVCANFMEAQAYLFAHDGAGRIVSRYFFEQNGSLIEDPGTGSACANLGHFLGRGGSALPLHVDVYQGAATGLPCVLHLDVDDTCQVRVGGRVREVMQGTLTLE